MLLGSVRRFPLGAYFTLAYGLSVLAAGVIGLPARSVSPASFVMFPVLVIGVGTAGVALTAATRGREGLADLGRRFRRWRLGRWYLVLLIPPLGILAVVTVFRFLVSPVFSSALVPFNMTLGFVAFGIAVGLLSGLSEEMGWTGFAYPRLSRRFGALAGAVLLGLLWGVWHFSVIDSLGAASPHGAYLPAYFASFILAMMAMRVLIAWAYSNTQSVLVAQLLHASSTASLVVVSPPHVTAAQEVLWYFAYAGLLWLVVAIVVARFGTSLTGRRAPATSTDAVITEKALAS